MTSIQDYLNVLLERARGLEIEFDRIDVAPMGSCYLASLYKAPLTMVISPFVYSACDADQIVAILKACVEMIERHAFLRGGRIGIASCQTEHSDGLAAFPHLNISTSEAKDRARANAYHEAVKRLAWAHWWDDESYAFEKLEVHAKDFRSPLRTIVEELLSRKPGAQLIEVHPHINSYAGEVVIFYLIDVDGGVFSGGAAGPREKHHETTLRGLNELFRHVLAAARILQPTNFYEKRLAYMASGQAADSLRHRLTHPSSRAIALPPLRFDEAIDHPLSDLVAAHRCFFEDAPEFVGGPLERLCL